MTDEVKACAGCKHFGGPDAEQYLGHVQPRGEPECKHPKAVTRDLIYGKAMCRAERAANKGCGKKGALWEARK